MINILSYVGMNLQSEVCLWTLLGLLRTIFDATLFKVNANLKQVWQMSMPIEMSMSVQRVLRTMISGIMLVQCFTVYVYLASYIVLLYPVFLEERPALVLPWLLLAAIRKLLCELTSLALGLGTCVLLGPAKPPCIRFLVFKIMSIMPAFYMWMLVYSYYHALKVASTFKTFPIVLPPSGLDYGLELAVRRRRTKSLFGEEQLRKKLVAGFYGERPSTINNGASPKTKLDTNLLLSSDSSSKSSIKEAQADRDTLQPLSANKYTDIGALEYWMGSEIFVPRGDRILEQFAVMLLKIGAFFKTDGAESINSQMFRDGGPTWGTRENMEAMPTDVTDTPPLVGNSNAQVASYLRQYPQIFMKKQGSQPDSNINQTAEDIICKWDNEIITSEANKSGQKSLSNKLPTDSGINMKNVTENQRSKFKKHEIMNKSMPTENKLAMQSLNSPKTTSSERVIDEVKQNLEQILKRLTIMSEEKIERSHKGSEDMLLSKLTEIKQSSQSFDEVSRNIAVPKQEKVIQSPRLNVERSNAHFLSTPVSTEKPIEESSKRLNIKLEHNIEKYSPEPQNHANNNEEDEVKETKEAEPNS